MGCTYPLRGRLYAPFHVSSNLLCVASLVITYPCAQFLPARLCSDLDITVYPYCDERFVHEPPLIRFPMGYELRALQKNFKASLFLVGSVSLFLSSFRMSPFPILQVKVISVTVISENDFSPLVSLGSLGSIP